MAWLGDCVELSRCGDDGVVMFFHGTWREAGVSAALGIIPYLLRLVANKFETLWAVKRFVYRKGRFTRIICSCFCMCRCILLGIMFTCEWVPPPPPPPPPYAFPFKTLKQKAQGILTLPPSIKSPLHQWPLMLLIGSLGYLSGYSSKHIRHSPLEFNGFVATLTIGLFANLHSRFFDKFSFNTILGIFIQVPVSWGPRGCWLWHIGSTKGGILLLCDAFN